MLFAVDKSNCPGFPWWGILLITLAVVIVAVAVVIVAYMIVKKKMFVTKK